MSDPLGFLLHLFPSADWFSFWNGALLRLVLSVKEKGHLRIRWRETELETFASHYHHDFVPRWKRLYGPLIAQSRHRMFQAPVQSRFTHSYNLQLKGRYFLRFFSLYGQGKHQLNLPPECKWDQDGFWYLLSVCSAVNRKIFKPLKAKSKTWGATLNEISCSKALVVAKGIKPDQIL